MFFPGIKRQGLGFEHPPLSSAGVKERVEVHLYSPSGPSWHILRQTLPVPLLHIGQESKQVLKPV